MREKVYFAIVNIKEDQSLLFDITNINELLFDCKIN